MEAKGQRIPGSRLLRDFCCGCGQPMRVQCPNSNPVCEECEGGQGGSIRSEKMRCFAQRSKMGKTRS